MTGSLRDVLERLFVRHFGVPPSALEAIAGDASPRARLRLVADDGRSAIGVPPGVAEEDRAFVAWTRALCEAGLPVPALYGVDEGSGACLVQDAGRVSLYDALVDARAHTGESFPEAVVPHFRDALHRLPRFQIEGGRVLDFSLAWPRADFDRRAMRWDLSWFKNMCLRLAGIPFHEDHLEDDFDRLLDAVDGREGDHFLHRDFQARNVMLSDEGPLFIDYQGGRRGPPAYDVAAMLWSGSSDLPDEVRDRLLNWYLEARAEHERVDEEAFRARLPDYAILRILQALGAYGFRGLHMRRPGFAARIGPAARNLQALLEARAPRQDLPELRSLAERILDREDLAPSSVPHAGGLVVRIGSFAYPRGIPRDPGGHGGGYVFDCRALQNPGREARYRRHSGLDVDVARRLAADAEVSTFLARTLALVDAQIERYLERGFDALSVHYGCTGGQHRSVWCAQRLAEHVRERWPAVRVEVEHVERGSWPPTATRP